MHGGPPPHSCTSSTCWCTWGAGRGCSPSFPPSWHPQASGTPRAGAPRASMGSSWPGSKPLWLQLPPRHEEVVMLMLLGLGTQPVAWGVCWPLPPACHLVDFVLCNVHATRDVDVHQVQGPPGCLKPNTSWAQPRPGRGGGRLTCARVTQPRTLV